MSQELDGTFAFLSRLVARMRDVNLFKSDWQNNVARVWSVTREKAISLLRQVIRFTGDQLIYSTTLTSSTRSRPSNVTQTFGCAHFIASGLVMPLHASCRQLGRPQRGAPPPLQYSLALDLVPQAHPFSFTYSRRQGYGLKDGLSQSMSWLRSLANSAEIAHFAAMIAQPPAELG